MSRLALVFALVSSLATTGHAERVTSVHSVAVEPTAQTEMEAPSGGRVEISRDTIREALRARREQNLAVFHQYQLAGVFPSNVYRDGKLNVWRDRDGHLCAAANIINQSGATKLVDQIARDSNFIRLGDVKGGPLMDWMLTSGFTQAEIAMIQEPYMPVVRRPSPRPMPVQPDLRQQETTRLLGVYRGVEKRLRAATDESLELAVDRLVQHPRLAASILARD